MEGLGISGRQEQRFRLGNVEAMSLSLQQDWQIRYAMMMAVQCDDIRVGEITKELQHVEDVVLLHAVTLRRPFHMPPAIVGADSVLGSENTIMRTFAFDVYDALDEHFDHEVWGEWRIVPYFAEHDDTRGSFCLGVFAETVVE